MLKFIFVLMSFGAMCASSVFEDVVCADTYQSRFQRALDVQCSSGCLGRSALGYVVGSVMSIALDGEYCFSQGRRTLCVTGFALMGLQDLLTRRDIPPIVSLMTSGVSALLCFGGSLLGEELALKAGLRPFFVEVGGLGVAIACVLIHRRVARRFFL